MADGTNSTLVLHPTGLSSITFDLAAQSGLAAGYVVPLGTLRFNEEKRLQIKYGEPAKQDGGKVTNVRGALVPISFDVIISDITREGLIQKAQALAQAVTNAEGGTLEYKPEGLSASVRSTFYRYLRSEVPRVKPSRENRWDKGPKSSGVYRLVLEVELQTQPFGLSDPDNPVAIPLSRSIVRNGFNAAGNIYNYFTVDADDIEGDSPALLQIRIKPTAAGATIGRLWIARRTEGLAYFQSIYDAYDAVDVSPGSVWSNVADASRNRGYYKRASFGSGYNNTWQGLRFTIANEASHRGRMALLIVARVNDAGPSNWRIRAQYQAGAIVQTIEPAMDYLSIPNTFRGFIIGETQLPPTEVSAQESVQAYVDVEVKRLSGDSAADNNSFDIDFLMLLPVDEHVLQVEVGHEGIEEEGRRAIRGLPSNRKRRSGHHKHAEDRVFKRGRG